jgi:putative transposase
MRVLCRLKCVLELEDENNRLKKIVADLTLDRAMLQDVLKRKL